jgi:prevent-host-death family protein
LRFGLEEFVETIAISKFKATCLGVLERVRRTKKPILITRFGQPVAEVVPPSIPARPSKWVGSLAGTGWIAGNIVAPAAEERDWGAPRS